LIGKPGLGSLRCLDAEERMMADESGMTERTRSGVSDEAQCNHIDEDSRLAPYGIGCSSPLE
jgi:hypothetical protein